MKIKVYQICYSPETLANVPVGFHALDYTDNSRPDWREFWPIRQFLLNNYLSDDVLYGFVSPKFNSKTNLDYEGILNFVSSNYTGEDLISFSPFWDLSSIFKNVFEQGDFFHPGLQKVCQDFCDHFVTGIDASNCINHSHNTIFCNYFIANKQFWNQWLLLGEKLFFCSESNNSELSLQLNSNTTYGIQQIPMKIFVQERLATICLLANKKFQCLPFNMFLTGASTTPFNNFLEESIISDALKLAYVNTNNAVYLNQFAHIRDKVIKSLNNL